VIDLWPRDAAGFVATDDRPFEERWCPRLRTLDIEQKIMQGRRGL
jgi:hypothetical protein